MKYIVFEAKRGWWWRMVFPNNATVCGPREAFARRRNARRAFEAFARSVLAPTNWGARVVSEFKVKRSGSRWLWRYVSANGRLMAHSLKGFKSEAEAWASIDKVKAALARGVTLDA